MRRPRVLVTCFPASGHLHPPIPTPRALALALQRHAPADFDVTIDALQTPRDLAGALGDRAADIIFLHGREATTAREDLRRRGLGPKLVAGWTAGVPDAIGLFFEQYADADAWIFSNQAYWDTLGRLPRTFVIPNGVDPDVFQVVRPLETRTPKVLWAGTVQQRWQQGYDHFIRPLRAYLRALGIEWDFRFVDAGGTPTHTPEQMAAWYNSGTILVCASQSEATPTQALEAAACGCTVVSTRVGVLPELIHHDVNGYLVDRSVPALVSAVQSAADNYLRLTRQMQSDIRRWHWSERSAECFQLFRNLLDGTPQPMRRRDLSSEVTVFVTTVGAPTTAACLERLREQDCIYNLQIIDRIAPMSAAFQRMLDECRTPYYVQVDEDMLLYPHAVQTLYDRITSAAPNVAIFAADLYDVHLRRCIIGVKIFRHAIVRQYPFDATDGFEKKQMACLTRDGYVHLHTPPGLTPVAGQTLGLHGVQWTPESIYERYMTLAHRRLAYPLKTDWFGDYPSIFLERFLNEPSTENFFALQGVIAGTLAAQHGEPRAKDYRTYAELPGFDGLRRFLDALGDPPQHKDVTEA